jgi:hypothetical protein
MLNRRQRQSILALEVIKEASLGDAGRRAEIFHRCGCVTLRSDDVQSRTEEFVFVSCTV